MKVLVSSNTLQGPALDHVVLQAIKEINQLDNVTVKIPGDSAPTCNPDLMLTLMNTLNIDLFWYKEYNEIEQTVVEADCTYSGLSLDINDHSAIATDVMTAVYRCVVLCTYGNKFYVDQSILDNSVLGTGIKEKVQEEFEKTSVSLNDGFNWLPWTEAVRFEGKKVLLRFKNGHIEDANLKLDDESGVYYVLFDGESFRTHIDAFMLMPERTWDFWIDCKKYVGENVLVRFQGGHVEDALISEDVNGQLLFSLYDNNIISDIPVAAMSIPG